MHTAGYCLDIGMRRWLLKVIHEGQPWGRGTQRWGGHCMGRGLVETRRGAMGELKSPFSGCRERESLQMRGWRVVLEMLHRRTGPRLLGTQEDLSIA